MATIVLADDEADLRAIYAPVLRMKGHEVLEASNGREAIELVRTRRPDMLLLDVWMPEFNGLEVLDELRYEPASGVLKVIMLSNLADADARLEAFGGGAVEYLVKGLPLIEILDRVEAALSEAAEAEIEAQAETETEAEATSDQP